MKKTLLTNGFVNKYPDFPDHMNELGMFVYYRTYSRFIPELKRRETWKETCRRATEYNVSLAVDHLNKIGYPVNYKDMQKEAEDFFDSMFNLRQFLSGRTLWVGGAENGVAEKYPLSNFNCSFINIRSWDDLGDLFYLLLVGTGVGFKATKEFAKGLPAIRTDVEIVHNEFVQRYPLSKVADTELIELDGEQPTAVIHVGDSKEGWVEALRVFFKVLTERRYSHIERISIYYDYIRPKGARLHTFGGTASGYEPLKEMFQGIEKVLNNEIDPSLAPLERIGDTSYRKVRPVHILDIGNLIGNNVVVGGVRRTAEIFLMDADDYESMFAKYGINGIWNEEKHKQVIEKVRANGLHDIADWLEGMELFKPDVRPLHHRRMSNNSIAFTEKPSREFLNLVKTMLQSEGEPGYINLEEARRRRPNAEGLNPCAEILLDSYGVCNLTTVNLVQFVLTYQGKAMLDIDGLLEAQKRSARAGLRMTLATLELPHWDKVQQRDRLLGTSLTGVKDAMGMLGYTEEQEKDLLNLLGKTARNEADKYAKEMRVSSPLLVTTVKPEGTISQVAGGVSSGLHWSHSPYFIRRIRINSSDPLAKAIQDAGWKVFAEVGTEGYLDAENLSKPEVVEVARTIVVEFPVKSGVDRTKDDITASEQFDTYFRFQKHYTEHNSSNTITVKPDEWGEAEQIVWDNWNEFTAVSFLSHDGGSYTLAPYEAISKEKYEEMVASMTRFDPDTLQSFETGEDSDLEGMDGCEGGVCPIR